MQPSYKTHISHRKQLFPYFPVFLGRNPGFCSKPTHQSKITKPESIVDAARARECDFDVFISYAPPSGGFRLAKERKSQVRQPMGFHITSGYRKVHPTFRSASGCAEEERKLLIPNNCWLQVSILRPSLPLVAHFLPSFLSAFLPSFLFPGTALRCCRKSQLKSKCYTGTDQWAKDTIGIEPHAVLPQDISLHQRRPDGTQNVI